MFSRGLDILITKGDGSDIELLISSDEVREAVSLPDASRYYLVLSPDGTRAAVLSVISVARPVHLTVFDLEFRHMAEFSVDDYRDLKFDWSPDGKKLLIAAWNGSSGMVEAFHIMDTSDEGFGEIVSLGQFNRPYAAAWAADGEYLLLIQPGAAYRMEIDGSIRSLACPFCSSLWPAEPAGAAFSPDGNQLALIYDYDQKPGAETAQMIVASSDLASSQIYPLGVYAWGYLYWSPDSEKIAFSRYGISGSDAGYTVGGEAPTVLDLTSDEILKLEVGSYRRIGSPWPCGWSGDSNRLITTVRWPNYEALVSYDLISEQDNLMFEEDRNGDETFLRCASWLPMNPLTGGD